MSTLITRPLLAGSVDNATDIKFPILASIKLDGLRIMKVNGKIVTRKFKDLPNEYVRGILEQILPDGIDGELMAFRMVEEGTRRIPCNFNEIQSRFMSEDGQPEFIFSAFDYVKGELDVPYQTRIEDLKAWYETSKHPNVELVLPALMNTLDEFYNYEADALDAGFEGVMIRSLTGKYKCGRGTLKEGILLKFKRFKDAEAEVLGYEEKLHNTNVKQQDEFGLSKRSSKKEGMVAANTLGTLKVRDITSGIEFGIGSGFDDEMKLHIWTNRDKYMGKLVKYKYQEVGMKEGDGKPRFPVFLGFRSELDM